MDLEQLTWIVGGAAVLALLLALAAWQRLRVVDRRLRQLVAAGAPTSPQGDRLDALEADQVWSERRLYDGGTDGVLAAVQEVPQDAQVQRSDAEPPEPTRGFVELDRAECLRLLGTAGVAG